LDILDNYKFNPKLLESLQDKADNQKNPNVKIFGWKLETKVNLMNQEKGVQVQHRREYYNDFEDCLRDYKNAKLKSIQKQTKVHLSEGDNGDSDSEYVDCTDSNDLKNQSCLSSKSMPHVSTVEYRESFSQQLEVNLPVKNRVQLNALTPLVKAQLNVNRKGSQIKHETSAQLTSHNKIHNQIIDTSCNSSLNLKADSEVSPKKKSISTQDNIHIPSAYINDIQRHFNQNVADKQSYPNKAVETPSVQLTDRKDEQTKRKSCKKRQDGPVKSPNLTQR
jgi:hypothetical protein